MPTKRRQLSSDAPLQTTPDSNAAVGIVSFVNESDDVDIRIFDQENGETPDIETVLTEGALLVRGNGNQIQLQKIDGGYVLSQWWAAAVPVDEMPPTTAYLNTVY